MAGYGAVLGLFAFAAVILAAPLQSALLFKIGACLIGVGGGFFAVGTLTAAMDLGDEDEKGPRPRRLGGRAGHGAGWR
jgi:BCD family chlorophyll transporter-like MFS transporter